MLTGKKIVLGVSGGIAAYKMANVASMLSKLHADIHVVMTENATHFITPETFEVLTGNHCYTDTFDRCMELHVPHIALGTQADAILIAPASADVVGKIANGIADDMLTTCVLPATCPVMLAPSMNVHMYENPIVQDNMKRLASYGYEIIEADEGYLACRDIGKGKLPPEHVLVDYIIRACAMDKDLAGPLYHESFDRQDGVCIGTYGGIPWRQGYTCGWTDESGGSIVCRYGEGCYSRGYV